MRVTGLQWGVKQSFRSYVEAAGGTITTGAGAARTPNGAIAFPANGGLTVEGDGGLDGAGGFSGEVRFEAHGGMLSVSLTGLVLEAGADGGSLKVADERGRPVEIAKLDLAARTTDDEGRLVIPATLSMDGSYLLGDHYPPRTALDPVRLTLAAD